MNNLAKWKYEFYPVPASMVKGKINRIRHSLRKWEGALPENLEKHGLRYVSHIVGDEKSYDMFDFDDLSCALCVKYATYKGCPKCPIVKYTGKRCDSRMDGAYCNSDSDPMPMIKLLREVLKAELEKANENCGTDWARP